MGAKVVTELQASLGLAPAADEIDRLHAEAIDAVQASTEAFFDRYEQSDCDQQLLAGWFIPRCWREIDYVFMLGDELRRYAFDFEPKHVVSLARQLEEEARHYADVSAIIRRLGGSVPDAVPEPARAWSSFLWECLERHQLGAIAAWWTSETSALGIMQPTVDFGKRYDMPDVIKVYQQVVKDEKFHIGLGRLLLDRYTRTQHDLDEVLRAVRGMHAIITGRGDLQEDAPQTA